MAHATAPDWTRAVACVVTGEIADVLAMLPARCFSRLNARYPSAAAICQCIRAAFAAAGICNRAIRRFVSLHTASCASSTHGGRRAAKSSRQPPAPPPATLKGVPTQPWLGQQELAVRTTLRHRMPVHSYLFRSA